MATQQKKSNKVGLSDEEKSTIIGPDLKIVGRVEGEGQLHIHGRVEGHVEVKGQLFIETSGVVIADVHATEVTVSGIVVGTIHAQECVLQEKAKVVGDVIAVRLRMEPGAAIRGNVSAGEESEAKNSQQNHASVGTEAQKHGKTEIHREHKTPVRHSQALQTEKKAAVPSNKTQEKLVKVAPLQKSTKSSVPAPTKSTNSQEKSSIHRPRLPARGKHKVARAKSA